MQRGALLGQVDQVTAEHCGNALTQTAFLRQLQEAELTAVVEPFYPKISEAGGRPPLPLERMLRVYFLQL